MKCLLLRIGFACIVLLTFNSCNTTKSAQTTSFFNGDVLPDAPELAARGEYHVGVRTVELIHKGQIDILKSKDGKDPVYDRPLKIEIWYPAIIPANKKEETSYEDFLGSPLDSTRPVHSFNFPGRAFRNAAPDKHAAYPLIIVSHGYPGSRVLLSYLTENLASKGYVVVAIDHTESTHHDQAGFASTLLNRSKDILFVLNQMAAVDQSEQTVFLNGLVDANNTALIGYSMGGYGVMNAAGAAYSDKLSGFFKMMTSGSIAIINETTSNKEYASSIDPRIKAVVAFAPWGMQRGIWDAEGLKGVKVPVFFVAGSQDDVSGYEDGTKAMFTGSVNADRYLLTYENARHNTAPNPPPSITVDDPAFSADYNHYAEPAWDQRRINNINEHFVTAFLGIYLHQRDYKKFLELPEKSNVKNWTGFKPRSSVGLELLHLKPGN
ncbi:MAG: dienelactone hydrolase [Chitinophagaceae bacterium]